MRIYYQQLLEREIIYLRKELDKYMIAKMYGKSAYKKNIFQQIFEEIKTFWRKYRINSILLIGLVMIFLLSWYLSFFADNLDVLIYLILVFEILLIIFQTGNFIIKPIIIFFKFTKSKKDSYYSTEAKQFKIANDTILALKIGKKASKNACKIMIDEINYTITLKKKIKIELSIVLLSFVLFSTILFSLNYYIPTIDIDEQNFSLDKIRVFILFGINIFNFLCFFLISFWNIESKEIIRYRRFVSILERAIHIAK